MICTMKKLMVVLVLMSCISLQLKAQEMSHVPRQISLEAGYRHLSSNTFDLKNEGVTLLFDYAWQLSGFTGRPAVYLTIPIGYTYLWGGEGSNAGAILSYGWSVRHNLRNWGSGTPFIGYGLLLNQLSVEDTDGRIYGHQTRFDFGYTFIPSARVSPFAKLEYSMTRYPSLGKSKADKISAVEMKAGVRF
jgi:hypothetical protein